MNTGSTYLFGRPDEYEIKNDILYRYEYINDTTCTKTPIITKTEFLACYKAWIKAESEDKESCDNCKHNTDSWDSDACDGCCGNHSRFKPQESEVSDADSD